MIVKFTQPNLSLFYRDSVLKKAPTQPAAFAVQAVSEHCLTINYFEHQTKGQENYSRREVMFSIVFICPLIYGCCSHAHTLSCGKGSR